MVAPPIFQASGGQVLTPRPLPFHEILEWFEVRPEVHVLIRTGQVGDVVDLERCDAASSRDGFCPRDSRVRSRIPPLATASLNAEA